MQEPEDGRKEEVVSCSDGIHCFVILELSSLRWDAGIVPEDVQVSQYEPK